MPSTVEQIKSRLNIADVVGTYIKLEKAGANLKARCPFHNEKTPSFYVSPTRESYHCFGCDKGGDMISFVQEIEGIDFMDALKVLADRAGVELKKEDLAQKSERTRLVNLMKEANKFFKLELRKNRPVIQYLARRGLKAQTIGAFQIGFAPEDWRQLTNYLKNLGYKETEMESVGLVIKGDKGYYDRFRSRIMFPICNMSGAVIGFTGRIFEAEKIKAKTGQEPAKYINSPQTILYDKSRVLYGIEKAKIPMRQKGACILVEGQMDLIMSHQAGADNAVAVSGTALTKEHLQMINGLSNSLIMAFDGDPAGFSASVNRAVQLAFSLGMDVKLALIPGEKDPADLILKDPKLWLEAIEKAVPIVDFCIEFLVKKTKNKDELAKEIRKIVLPHVRCLENKIEQSKFIKKIAGILDVSEQSIIDELNKIEITVEKIGDEKSGAAKVNVVGLLPNAIQNKKIETWKEKTFAFLEWQRGVPKSSFDIKKGEGGLEEALGENEYKKTKENLTERLNELVLEAEVSYAGTKDPMKEFKRLLDFLRGDILKLKLEEEVKRLKIAEKLHDEKESAERLKNCLEIGREINKLKKNQ